MTSLRSLSSMAQGLLEVEGIDFLSRPRWMDVKVRIPLDMRRDGSKAAAKVVEEVLRRVREVKENERALEPGAVYCYFSESSKGESSRATDIRQVFDGYGSTGRPVFSDFVTMAIERKDAGITELLAGEDMIVTRVTMGRVLRTAQLAEFGKASPVYRILGQVDAGLFPVLNSKERAAFSFQLLRGKTLEGLPRLRVNPVGLADITDLADPAIAQILSRFQQKLDVESLRLAGMEKDEELAEEKVEEFVLPLLQELAKQIGGRARRKGRRTQHANERAAGGDRPTSKAYEDASKAHDQDLYWDEQEGTIVVLGPRSRVHVFTDRAKHVTSVMMQGNAIGKRRQQGRWRPAEPGERGEFRIQLRKQMALAEAPPAPQEPPTEAGSPPSGESSPAGDQS